jgi:predicted nucleic acid-binding protein
VIVSFDANVLVYSTGQAEDERSARALEVLERGLRTPGAVLLLQSLAEFSNVTIRKSRLPIATVVKVVADWRAALPVHALAEADFDTALEAVARHRLAFWDAMLRATARRAGVRYLLTEDFQDERELGGVTFVNPFDPANDALIDRILPLTAP